MLVLISALTSEHRSSLLTVSHLLYPWLVQSLCVHGRTGSTDYLIRKDFPPNTQKCVIDDLWSHTVCYVPW